MNILELAIKAGTTIFENVVPGGAAIVGAVNALLPDDKKLPTTATGEQIKTAVDSLPPEQKAAVLEKQYDVQITTINRSADVLTAMLENDHLNPHTTRPYIAKGCFQVLAFTTMLVVTVWAIAVIKSDEETIKAVVDGWPWLLAVTGVFATLLKSYFGILTTEHKNKIHAAGGHPPAQNLVGSIISAFKGK